MPRAPLDEHAIEAFRGRLADVGERLFAQHGFAGVTLRAVADALGVSPMTPYRYVEDKDALLTLVRVRAFQRFAERQVRAAASESDPRRRIRALGRSYVDFALEQPDAYRMMFQLEQPSGDDPALVAAGQAGFRPLLEAVTQATAAGDLEGDPAVTAHLLWASTHGVVTLHLAGKLGMGVALEDLVERILDGVSSRPTQKAARPLSSGRPQRPRKPVAASAAHTPTRRRSTP